MDRMLDPLTLAGEPRPVVLACHDWQIFDPRRAEKRGLCWHTVEGPFVLRRKGVYYQTFSGGNWQRSSYGVSYAETDRLDGEWRQATAGDKKRPRMLLATVEGKVMGPGHNSVVRGPDNRQLYCVYHRWHRGEEAAEGRRVLAIDPLDWAGRRLEVRGPSSEPRPAPAGASFADYFDGEWSAGGRREGESPRSGWAVRGGRWSAGAGELVQASAGGGRARAGCGVRGGRFLAEVSLRALRPSAGGEQIGGDGGVAGAGELSGGGGYGIALLRGSGEEDAWRCLLLPASPAVEVRWRLPGGAGGVRNDHGHGAGQIHERREQLALPAGFDPFAYHLLRVEVDGRNVRMVLDEAVARWTGTLDDPVDGLALVTDGSTAAFSGFALTAGWEDLFDCPEGAEPGGLDWLADQPAAWRLEGGRLHCNPGGGEARISKGPLPAGCLIAINARLELGAGELRAAAGCGYGFILAGDESAITVTLELAEAGWSLVAREGSDSRCALPLPSELDPTLDQQLRLRVEAGRLAVTWQDQRLIDLQLGTASRGDWPRPSFRLDLLARGAPASFEMVRVTGQAAAAIDHL